MTATYFQSFRNTKKSLKATCEELIMMAVTKLIVDPMLSFSTKGFQFIPLGNNCKSFIILCWSEPNSRLSHGKTTQGASAFAAPDKVAELVQKVNTAIQQVLPLVMVKMKLYLQNPSTRTILFKPVKTNIVEAHIQVQSLLKSEYSPEEQSLTGSECTTRQSL
ncbi:hypothetical protein EZV62_013080 [Acer yangbiense]|uniref:Uncharacterized protein n=1 Tax=Acer yangbiense TaxID=1000413 RepID=A0A5C7HX70_9ROSI|nr:hypothetical protein EZV62_013080 [Acer yangbiense]